MSKLCSRCGKRLPADPTRRVYSKWTHNYYCVDDVGCGRRARRRRKAVAA